MDDVTLDVSDADHGLRERLNAEIIAFNEAATGYADGGLLCITARGTDGELRGRLYGWTWGGLASSTCSGCGKTSGGPALGAGSWPRRNRRSAVAAATRWPCPPKIGRAHV